MASTLVRSGFLALVSATLAVPALRAAPAATPQAARVTPPTPPPASSRPGASPPPAAARVAQPGAATPSAARQPQPTTSAKRPATPPTRPARRASAPLAVAPTVAPAPHGAAPRTARAPSAPILKTTLAGGKVSVWVKAQIRDRFESHGRRDLDPDTRSELITQRTRLGLGVGFLSRYKVFVQLQDVRAWGSETSTLGDYAANGFDLHQGWAQARIWGGLKLRVGRQEIVYDDHRLVGNVNWSQQGRVFDAVRLQHVCPRLRAEAFYARLREKDGDENQDADRHLVGLYVKLLPFAFARPSLMFLSEVDYDEGVVWHRETLGSRVYGGWKGLSYDVAFYYQLGRDQQTALDYSAFLFAGRLGYRAPVRTRPGLTLWAELLSGDGDDTDGKNRSFDTLYATNHKFYGLMDYFLNIPRDTGGRGLQDFGARFTLAPLHSLGFTADYHLFRLMVSDPNGEALLGHEFDFTLRYVVRTWVQVQAGYSVMLPGPALSALKAGQDATEHWFYLQTNVAF